MSRQLVSIRRSVPRAADADYDAAWLRLQTAVTALGAHAWRFRSAAQRETCLEFLEFAEAADVREAPAVSTALRQLEAIAPAVSAEDWVGG